MNKNIDTFDDLLLHLVSSGFDIHLGKGDGCFTYEIFTGAKSNLTISKHPLHLCNFEARYDHRGSCEDYQDFLYELKGCLCGRDYANAVLFEFLEKEGILTKVVETKVRYK